MDGFANARRRLRVLNPSCPRFCVCSINLMALVASLCVVRIARRLFRPGKRPSSSLRRSRSLRHSKRTWATVCIPSRQSHVGSGMPGTRRLRRKALSPIFSVLICTRIALSRLLRFRWSWSTLFRWQKQRLVNQSGVLRGEFCVDLKARTDSPGDDLESGCSL